MAEDGRIGEVIGQGDQHDVEQDLEDPALVREVDEERHQRLRPRRADLGLVVDLHAPQVDPDERQQEHVAEDGRQAVVQRQVADEQTQEARHRGQGVEHPDGAAFRQAQRHEPVRRVVASSSRYRPAGELPQDRHKERVEDRDEQDQHRHRQHGQEAARTPAGGVQERRAGQEEADEH